MSTARLAFEVSSELLVCEVRDSAIAGDDEHVYDSLPASDLVFGDEIRSAFVETRLPVVPVDATPPSELLGGKVRVRISELIIPSGGTAHIPGAPSPSWARAIPLQAAR